MRILITGGTGSIGSRLLVPLVRRGDNVILFDVRTKPQFDSPECCETKVIEADLADRQAVLAAVERNGVESIFHLGAVLSSDAENEPDAAWRANMDGISNVLEAARLLGVKRVIFSSTVATYGTRVADPLPLDAPQWPISLYGVTKVAGERLGFYYHHRFGVDFRGVRLPVIVAPYGASGGASAYCSAAYEGAALHGRYEFYVNPTTRAPMLYISDAVKALLDLHDAASEKLSARVYNIAGISASAEELAAAIQTMLPRTQITYKPDPLRTAIVESWSSRIDDSQARLDWNWQPTWDLDHMTEEILRIYGR